MKFTRQFDQMDCGPACVRMIALHFGRDYPLSYIRSLSRLTREGVSVAGVRNALGVHHRQYFAQNLSIIAQIIKDIDFKHNALALFY